MFVKLIWEADLLHIYLLHNNTMEIGVCFVSLLYVAEDLVIQT
jgi:hypothetical protein